MTTKQTETQRDDMTVARPIAPEDVRAGTYVAMLQEVDTDSFVVDADNDCIAPTGTLRRTHVSLPYDVEPQFVKAICLPFILAECTRGDIETIDTRRYRLASLPDVYGDLAFAKLRERQAKEAAEDAKSDAERDRANDDDATSDARPDG